MSHVVLVRHGRAAAAWDAHADPGLDEVGWQQAGFLADALQLFGPLPLVTSPLARCRDTATPLAERWGVEPVVDPRVGEIESPTPDLQERGRWLREVMAGSWDDLPADLQEWRGRVIEALLDLEREDAVVVTHFVAINAVVGEATGDRRVVCFAPDHCSRTEVRVEGGRLELVELGGQARTLVR